MARITLAMIVKNEEGMLPACLASIVDAVDEIVVVDTGSTDGTRAIAEAAGAIVVDFPWVDDFSAARNASLAAASGQWVLVLDADERLGPGGAEAIRAIVEADKLDCGMLPLHNARYMHATHQAILSGEARIGEPVLLPRLFRVTDDLRYVGVVHESVALWLSGREDRVGAVGANILHYGAVPSFRAAMGKDDRNLALLEIRCANEPQNTVALTYLSIEYVRTDQLSRGRVAQERAWVALGDAMERGGQRPSFVALATLRMQFQMADGVPEDAIATAVQAGEWGAMHPNVDFFRGRALELCALDAADEMTQQRLLLQAGGAYCRALAERGRLFPEEVQGGVTGWLGQVRLGTVLIQVGEYQEALKAFEDSLTERPGLLEALLGACEARIGLGQVTEALSHLEPLLGEDRPDPWFLAAKACEALSLPADVARFRASGTAHIENGWIAAHRKQWIVDSTPQTAKNSEPTPVSDGFVFIGGAGRSGTTLFRALVHAHPRMHCGPEVKLVTEIARLREQWWRTMGPDLRGAGVTSEALDDACAAFIGTLMRSLVSSERRIAEKTPHNILHIEWLASCFPDARFVHVVRDGRAVAASLVRQNWQDSATGESVWYCKDVRSAAKYWREAVLRGFEQAEACPERVLVVRYEDLVTHTEAEMRRVFEFLGEEWDPAVLRHADAVVLPSGESSSEAVANPIHTGAVTRWRSELSSADLAEIDAEAGDLLRMLGYDSVLA